MNLSDWLRLGWLSQHQTSRQEISDLLALAQRDLAASRTPGLHADWRLAIAYNAALQLATAALAACGYRAERAMHHYRVVQSLALTLGVPPAIVDQLDAYRRKRHQGAYERAGIASEQEADEMLALAAKLRQDLLGWLRVEHPDLTECGDE